MPGQRNRFFGDQFLLCLMPGLLPFPLILWDVLLWDFCYFNSLIVQEKGSNISLEDISSARMAGKYFSDNTKITQLLLKGQGTHCRQEGKKVCFLMGRCLFKGFLESFCSWSQTVLFLLPLEQLCSSWHTCAEVCTSADSVLDLESSLNIWAPVFS